MIFYISDFYKRFVTRNNGTTSRFVKIFNHTSDTLEVSIINQNNQILTPPEGNYYLVGSFVKKAASTPVFLTTDYVIENDVIKFTYSTYTSEFLNLIKGEDVQIALEIGYTDSENKEHVVLQDTGLASQRYYVERNA